MRCIRLLLPSDLNLLSLTVIFDDDHHDYSYSIQKAEMLDENLLGEATHGECRPSIVQSGRAFQR
jgi:hypothetical protein